MLHGLEHRVLLSSSISSGKLTITGTDNADQILVSLSGNSVYVYDNGAEKLYTGVTSISADTKGGNDLLRIAQDVTVNASVVGGSGNDSLRSGGGNDTMRGGDGNDSLAGYGGNDVLHGDNNSDTLVGGSGNDALHGGGGDDRLQGGGGGDYLDGGSGNDTTDFTERTQPVKFTLYGSTVYTDPVTGLGGQGTEQDVTWSVETVQGGSAADVLTYQGYDNQTPTGNPVRGVLLSGNGGTDILAALNQPTFDQANSVTLKGGDGGDSFDASSGPRIHVLGEAGDDYLNLGDEENNRSRITADLGSGYDTVRYQSDPASGTLTMPAGAERLFATLNIGGSMTINGNGLDNHIILEVDPIITLIVNALGGNDRIDVNLGFDPNSAGSEGTHYLNGGSGNDTIQAGPTSDVIHGNDGNDYLFGGAGDDTLFGDAGTDFVDGQGGTDSENP